VDARARWEEWERRSGYQRERGEPRSPAGLEKWAERKAAEVAPRLLAKLSKQGGFSVRPFAEHESPSSGVMVSLPTSAGLNRKIDLGKRPKRSETEAMVGEFFTKALQHIVMEPDMFVGGWMEHDASGEPMRIHLDVSRRWPTEKLDAALKEGREHDQIAVFRLDDMKEFPTGGTGE
jgi:hypothetical protein